MLAGSTLAFALDRGSISGTARDAQGAVIPGVSVQLRNEQTGVVDAVETDSAGFYRFSALPVGHYDVSFRASGFEKLEQTGVVIDVDSARQVDVTLRVGSTSEQITVTTSQAQIETETAQMGEVIGGQEMENLPLNGRAFTDLLSLQPGVVPISAAMFGSESPSNDLNNGLLSISGAQDMHEGFMVNGANTTEGNDGGTFLVPTLDSIAEFRIITNNAGAEYGNYSGGLVNVVTKSGTNSFHGDAFEFYRNTNLDAANYFSAGTRGVYNQHQFGGTLGGPIYRNRIFFFGDYQGTRQSIGASTGLILVPSSADKSGDLSDVSSQLTGTVNGASWAAILSTRLGHTVTSGEPYYTAGCASTTVCVFPGAQIPQTAWDPVSKNVPALIPDPNQGAYFETSANPETLTDDKGGVRGDVNTRVGAVSFYYHLDPWSNTTPYNPGWAGSTLPGFPSTALGKAQLYVASLTTKFGSSAVNVFTASTTRNKNISGTTPAGPSLASLGFAAPSADGMFEEAGSQYQNWPELSFNNYTLGAYNSVITQYNNTYQGQDDFSKIIRTHTLKFGADYHWDQVDIAHPNNGGNGIFGFNGTETGYDFLDMIIGAPNYMYQGAAAGLNLRSRYVGVYAEDSWRAARDLVLNYGVRWEVSPYWWDEHNMNPVVLLGVQSTVFPTAPTGYVFPGDAGVPKTMAFTRYNNFGPRLGIAYTPTFTDGPMHTVFGDHGKSSIRLGFGMYYTNIQGANTFNFASPPYALFYGSPQPPLFSQPFIDRSTGHSEGQKFPLPPVDPKNVNWANYEPIGSKENPLLQSPTPYEEHFDFSIEREVSPSTVASISYVGTYGHHLIVSGDNNPGNPALCLSLSQENQVVPGSGTCGPYGENGTYSPVGGGTVNGTRGPFGNAFGDNAYQLDIGNSTYSALEATLRHTSTRLALLLSYTFSKAMDNGSGFGDQVLVYGDHNFYRAISAYDLPQNFAASYTYELPFDYLFKRNNNLTRGWKISGITQFTDGLPIQISEPDDRDLRGDTGIIYSGSTDEPNYTKGKGYADRNPRHRKPYLNTSLWSQEPLGTIGNSPKRMLHSPGMDNWNLALLKDVHLRESMAVELRAEFFNVFNHAQFYGIGSVDGNWDDGPSFGLVTSAADPRIGQLAVKFNF